jgi:hypothetical protein
MPLKVTGTTTKCRDCPYRSYYSGGVYNCLKAGDVALPHGEADRIPSWCPLPDWPIGDVKGASK